MRAGAPGAARMLAVLVLACVLAACLPRGDSSRPLPVETRPPARGPADRLVVILPGRRDDLDALRGSGIADVFARHWPSAEIVLAEATLAYYRDGVVGRRLHDEIIAPARARGIHRIWICGASLGGLGASIYAIEHPGNVEGLILLAPYLGEPATLDEVVAAGGLASFDASAAQPVHRGNVERELWKGFARWARSPSRAPQVWVAYGRADEFARAVPALRALVPDERLLVRDGGHAWRVWTPAAEEIVARIAAERSR